MSLTGTSGTRRTFEFAGRSGTPAPRCCARGTVGLVPCHTVVEGDPFARVSSGYYLGQADRMTTSSSKLLAALLAVDAVGAAIAVRDRIAGEPFGIGASLDVRRPAVLIFWGTGLSAPVASLIGTLAIRRSWPAGLRVFGLLFTVGALSEPVFWGRRRCSALGRLVLVLHTTLAAALAVAPHDTRSATRSTAGDVHK